MQMAIIWGIAKMQNLHQLIISKIHNILNKTESRENVSLWAMELIDDDNLFVENNVDWAILTALGAVDIKNGENYLYETIDFDEWLDRLNHNPHK